MSNKLQFGEEAREGFKEVVTMAAASLVATREAIEAVVPAHLQPIDTSPEIQNPTAVTEDEVRMRAARPFDGHINVGGTAYQATPEAAMRVLQTLLMLAHQDLHPSNPERENIKNVKDGSLWKHLAALSGEELIVLAFSLERLEQAAAEVGVMAREVLKEEKQAYPRPVVPEWWKEYMNEVAP